MGVPINLKDIQSGFLSAAALTANNTLIEAALDKALDRTGSTNNAMLVNLDMGANSIINTVTDLSDPSSLLTVGALGDALTRSETAADEAEAAQVAAALSETNAATSAQASSDFADASAASALESEDAALIFAIALG
jgi:hypothetical protein